MKKRLWIPIAVVLVMLVGATLAVGSVLRTRLADAEAVLVPFTQREAAALTNDDAALPACETDNDIAEQVQSFYAAVDEGASDLFITDPTFDSFLLESAIARVNTDTHQLLLRARMVAGEWCLGEAVFSTEE